MSKPLLLFKGPVATRSGYGDHSRDLLKSIFDLDRFDVKIIPTRWGNTPQNQIDPTTEIGRNILDNIATNVDRQPDVFVQVTVANEFERIGKFNVGITAGVETTIAPKDFIDGCNRMDLVLVPSEFTKKTLIDTVWDETDKVSGRVVKQYKIERPIEVVHEGVDLDVFLNPTLEENFLDNLETDFNFLLVGHWLQGELGHDRKDVGMTLKTFCTVFKGLPKGKQPGLIMKTSSAGFSVEDREKIKARINSITDEFGEGCPPIYLLFGDLKESEMAALYNHPKVKAMVSFTKGEGYGRPLAEFSLTGKPIVVSKWSGYLDFLPEENTKFIDGDLKEVHPSAANNFLLKESKWFYANYSDAARKLSEVFSNYKKELKRSAGLATNTKKNFSLEAMNLRMKNIFDTYIKIAKKVELKLPEIKKL